MRRWGVLMGLVVFVGCASPEAKMCKQVETLCAGEGDQAEHKGKGDSCEADMQKIHQALGDAEFAKLTSCLEESKTCGGVSGCLLPAFLKAGSTEISDFLKGLGKSSGIGDQLKGALDALGK